MRCPRVGRVAVCLLLLTPTAAAPKSAHVAEAHGAPRVDESRGHNRSSRRRVPPPQAAAAAAFTEASREEIASALAKEASHSTADFCFVSVAFLVASFVHGIAGFGAGIVAMSIVPLQLPVMEAVPIVAVFSLCICAGLALQLRGALSNPSVRPVLLSLVVGCVIGVPLGGVLLTRADPRWLRIALGMCMLLFVGERVMHDDDGAAAERRAYAAVAEGDAHALRPVAMEQIQPSPLTSPSVSPRLLSRLGRPIEAEEPPASPKIKHRGRRTIDHPLVGVAVGLASGVLGGALNEAGPPVVIYLTLKQWPKDDVKATLQVYFTLVSLAVVTMMACRGILQPRHLYYDATGLPAAVLGASAGVCLYRRIDQELFGRILVAAMLVGGVTYIGHAAAELLGEAKALPNPLHHIGWMLGFYVDAVLDPHVGS
eukprot:scaffold109054_cov63-Phaeocystis_antarctica.AAC.2